ncbi:MAG: SCP2 sterol-binding domain-containing protein [Nitrincola sp.]|nr:SCP2 sterol-binding domain-containing protein [Nitrincola sp.]
MKLTGFEVLITLTLKDDKLKLSQCPGEVTISGDLITFLQLARKEVDADGLFFQRKLLIEGDTELGLGVRNLLDGLDWSIEESKLGLLCCRLADFRQGLIRRKSAFN